MPKGRVTWTPGLLRLALVALLVMACGRGERAPSSSADGHERMKGELAAIGESTTREDPYLGEARRRALEAKLGTLRDVVEPKLVLETLRESAEAELALGREEQALARLVEADRLVERRPGLRDTPGYERLLFSKGTAWMRVGETENCCVRNMPESCILPIAEGGRHTKTRGSTEARRAFVELLERPEPRDPGLREHREIARWLLNIAAMTLGDWPDGVDERWRIPATAFRSPVTFPRFPNIAAAVGANTFSQSGGAVGADFSGDGYLDILTSSWDPRENLRYLENDRQGGFVDRTEDAGLKGITGGLNLVPGDFDNDGFVDFFVIRGAWMSERGLQPNSLVRNLGAEAPGAGARFRDVTYDLGLAEPFLPTMTAAWADYDLDGDLDLFVGNQTDEHIHAPCALYRNDGPDGFVDTAAAAGVTNDRYTAGAVWGDLDDDGLPDLIVSNLFGANRVYRNQGDGTFIDTAREWGLTEPRRSFPLWVWDFDNDGRLDIYVAAYEARVPHILREYLGKSAGAQGSLLFRNLGAGRFAEVSEQVGLTRATAPMGVNFGDLDNDGFLDFYLGTGDRRYFDLMPNLMYWNRPSQDGRRFEDVSFAGGFAHVQKGHGVVFADFDHDGDQDVFEQMGGALVGDRFGDVFYENPGWGNRHISLELVGTGSNRSAIGARVTVTVRDADGSERRVHRQVDSGGSFGANPFRVHVGLGKEGRATKAAVRWPAGGAQEFALPDASMLRITEGRPEVEPLDLPPISFRR